MHNADRKSIMLIIYVACINQKRSPLLKPSDSFLFGESKKKLVNFGLYESSLSFYMILYEASTVYKKKS